jgi:uncharacterized protein YndB with AHSA1/START domain
MSKSETLNVVDAYHQAWTTKRFDDAIALLSPSLQVEVPINNYATPEAFAEALVRFGGEVASVEILSELAGGDEAMILYDMEVPGLGVIRIVEHFTIGNGKIVRLRQIHDTVPMRAGGFDTAESEDGVREEIGSTDSAGYGAEVPIEAPLGQVFEAITSLEGLIGWWASNATGSCTLGSSFELGFAGMDESITWRVETVVAPTSVAWTCLSHTGLPDWDGTKVVFELTEHDTAITVLKFQHIGLVPELACYEQCHAGWEHFLPSLKSYCEKGQGSPFAGHHH